MSLTSSVRRRYPRAFPAGPIGTVPRDVRFTPAGIAMVVVVCVMVTGAVASVILLSIAAARTRQPRERATTTAQTVAVDARRGEHPRRTVRFRFEADGRSFEGVTRLRERDRRAAFEGAPIGIEYVVSDPAVNWISGYAPRPVPVWTIPLVSGVLLLVAAALAARLRRDWILLSEGRVTQARVAGQKKVHRDKHTAFEVTCSFLDLSGATQTMRYDVAKAPPALGTPVTVVYHRDNPRWSRVYPLTLVRPLRAEPR